MRSSTESTNNITNTPRLLGSGGEGGAGGKIDFSNRKGGNEGGRVESEDSV